MSGASGAGWSSQEKRGLAALGLGGAVLCAVLVGLAGLLGLGLAAALLCTVVVAVQLQHRRKLVEAIETRYRRTEALLALYRALPGQEPLPALRQYVASPELLAELVRIVLERKPRLVVELGSGLSTILTARCLAQLGEGGRVVSFDHEARFAQQTRERLERAGLSEVASVQHAPLTPLEVDGVCVDWYDRQALSALPDGAIDLLLVDGPPGAHQRLARYPALPELRAKLSQRAVVVLDDARRPDEQVILERWRKRFPELECSYVATEKGTGLLKVEQES